MCDLIQVTTHTWQSMKDHFRKKIVPHINNYRLRKLDVAKLTGTTTQSGGTKNPTPPQDVSGEVTLPCVQDITHTLTRVSHWGRKLYSTVQYSTVQYSTVQYSTVQYSTVQYNTIQ